MVPSDEPLTELSPLPKAAGFVKDEFVSISQNSILPNVPEILTALGISPWQIVWSADIDPDTGLAVTVTDLVDVVIELQGVLLSVALK